MNKNNRDLNDYLTKHKADNSGNSPTHTRIGDRTLSVYGGSYFIEDDEDIFYKLYEFEAQMMD